MSLTKTDREREPSRHRAAADPVVSMLGVGRQIWEQEGGDRFVERLRMEDPAAVPSPTAPRNSMEDLSEAVWRRIRKHQGNQFHTARGLPLTFKVEGNGIWFFRKQARVNRKVTRAQVDVAISRCPLKSTTEIKDLMDYPYLYAILMDPRIRDQAW